MTKQDTSINSLGIETGHERGAWMQTVSGGRFYPLDPRPEEFLVEDFSHALAYVNRFGGHLLHPVSVAQHSCLVHDLMPDEWGLKFLGLIHDVPEAYIGDLIRPVKFYDEFFQDTEENIWKALLKKYGLKYSHADYQTLKHFDNLACSIEKDSLFENSELWSGMLDTSKYKTITSWTAPYAKGQFMRRYNKLMREREPWNA